MAERDRDDRDLKRSSTRDESGSEKKRENQDKSISENKDDLRVDWRSFNETQERIIRKLARQEMKKQQEEIELNPSERERSREQSNLFREEDDTMQRLEEEKKHLRQLRDKLRHLQGEQETGRERSRKGPQKPEKKKQEELSDEPEKPEIDGPLHQEEQEHQHQTRHEPEPVYKSDKRGLSGFIAKRSKTEAFLLGVLTGMAIIFLINFLMAPPTVTG